MEFEIPQTECEKEKGYGGLLDCSIPNGFENDCKLSDIKKITSSIIKEASLDPLILYSEPKKYGYLHLAAQKKVLSNSICQIAISLVKYNLESLNSDQCKQYRSTLKMIIYLESLIDIDQLVIKSVIDVLQLPFDSIFTSPDTFFLDTIRQIATKGIKTIDSEFLNKVFIQLTNLNHIEGIVTGLIQLLSEDNDIVKIANSILRNNSPVLQKFLRQLLSIDTINPKLLKSISILFPLLPELVPESKLKLPSILHCLLDQQEHILRNAVIECYANILLDTPNDQLYDCLTERFHDINSFVRVKVLQMWQMLVEHRCIPLERFNKLTSSAVERLNDKSTPVRKNAISLLQAMLVFNPYSVILRRDLFESKLQETAEMLKENVKEESKDDSEEEEQEFTVPVNKILELFEGTGFQHVADTELLEAKKQEVLKNFIEWLKNSIEFISVFEEAVDSVERILESTSVLDLKEAIKFFGSICQYKIPKGARALKKTLELLFSKEVDVQNVIVEAVSKALCEESPQNTVNNLLIMTNGSNIGEELCIKKLVELLIQKKVIGPTEIDYLWAYMAGKLPSGGDMEALTALTLLSFIGAAKPSLILNKISLLNSICFKKGQLPTFIYRGCQVLYQLYDEKNELEKISANDPTIIQIMDCLDETMGSNTWIALCQLVLDLVYKAVDNPNEIGKEIILRRVAEVGKSSKVSNVSKLLSAVGGVARKQGEIYEKMKEGVVDEVEKKKGKKGKRISVACENKIHEVVGEVLEDGLLGEFVPIINDYCKDIIEGKYNEDNFLTFRAVVVNSLCSFMMVSQHYCEEHLQELFTILENTQDECVRSNIVYYVGDFACRYPNLLEGWIKYLYGRLKDPSALVRRSAVIVLSELIFHDIIKVKGSIYLMGLALVDDEERVRDLAHTFFQEYSSKTNAIYNVLPDLISSLGNEDISREHFRYIIKYVFSFISKDKQHEQLMNKLCSRFTMNEQTPKQWEYTAYCLSLLSYNEKTLKKLINSVKIFGNKLHITEVKEAFISLCQRLRKFAKPEMKVLIEGFEKIIIKEGGEDELNEKEEENNNQEMSEEQSYDE
ncbi:HEAT repeat domain containing protein [Entamoeba histolytica HM-1:IMSS-B]|uniref:HEAT repeat domain containing protein n=4 Tax=Entamoeba histolytica TaxID=5759 RepID=C4M515_ENTH1|nr:HEAT repeat domain containing protein [Entamoeba histolytica HM-1:IMSS]EAL49210.1 HEAT repeat domain containing protein [Entamoeba histolytica HM-1:IMSS]EMH76929.1 HEAT repeat domain containing protein [Entamoeba histolytica HM-1:IMSS-B]ENY60406.1 HEAT repeat domain containing protein [Entamoeba histolytica HM-1:IMSS-A]GAT96488.1 heat repeat domain containing protein [Entamoeba histolytica]|eukprot:XP_654597.1 HEAT repeat domain containing protein [Entamoeba histolytica HM-1:IMSS]